MGYQYVKIDGQPVETNVADAFNKMAEAFRRQFGLTLHVRSGMRTTAQQQALYDLFLKGRGNQAAKPGQSDHEDGGPTGPRALDLYDSGADRGVLYAGTVRSNWLKRNAPKFGFIADGFNFRQVEPWHYKFTGPIGAQPQAPAAVGDTELYVIGDYMTEDHKELVEEYKNPFGLEDCRGMQVVARLYTKNDGDKTALDNDWGPKSASGFTNFLRAKYGYKGNDVFGPVQAAAVARWLRARWGYKGDNVMGPIMRSRLQVANDENYKVRNG